MTLDASLYVARLAEQATALRSVRSALSLDWVLTQSVTRSGDAFVIPLRDWATGPQGIGVGRIVSSQIGVILLVMEADASGSRGIGALTDLRESVDAALEKWVPAPGWSPTLWQEGRLTHIGNGAIWWTDVYQTQTGRSIHSSSQ